MKEYGDKATANFYSIYRVPNNEMPVIANCPIATIEKAKQLFKTDEYFIMYEANRRDMKWVFGQEVKEQS